MSSKCGVFHQSYKSDIAIFQTWFAWGWMVLLFAWLLVFPFVAKPIGKALGTNVLYLANLIGIYIIGAQGLNLLTGYTGQISLGHGAFMGVGAYASAILTMKLGVPFWFALPLSGLVAAVVGMFFGIPSLRLKGLYLAIATMAAQFIIQYVMRNANWLTGGSDGMSVRAPVFFVDLQDLVLKGEFHSLPLNNDRRYYFLVYALVILATLFTKNLTRSRVGRAFVAIRDRYLSAEVMGVNIWGYRILSFGVSSFMVGIAGSLWAHYVLVISDEHFTIGLSVQYLASIIIGGLGSVTGAIYGAIFMTLLPELLRIPERAISHVWENAFTIVSQLREGTFGLLVVLFIIFEPDGLAHRWQKIKAYWKLWPFSY
jgi:branched-chain amino acid transport system permease protein